MSPLWQEDDAAEVKGEVPIDASPPKKQKTAGPKSGKPKAAKKVWDDGEYQFRLCACQFS